MIILTSTQEKCQNQALVNPDLSFYIFPCITYSKPSDNYKALDQAIRANHLYEWVFFLSPKAVESFFDRLLAIGGNFFNLATHLKFAVIGKATKDFLENEINLPADFMPSQASSESMIDEFCQKYKYDFACAFKILLPRSELAQDDLKNLLEASNNYVLDIVPAYNTCLPEKSIAELKDFTDKFHLFTGIIFTSKSCVDNFYKLTEGCSLDNLKVFSIGPKTTKAFRALYPSHKNIIESQDSHFPDLLKL